MKKLLAICAIFLAISCTHQDQKIKLDLSFDETNSKFQNAASLDLALFDDRSQKEIIGKKIFGDEKITISSEQNLAKFLQQKISENLAQRGFKKGNEKLVEIHIESLQYKAKRKFFIGTSKASASFKVIVKNSKTGSKFTKNFDLSLKNKHFIAPLESTDAATINALLQEIIENILSDEALLKNL